MMMELFGRDSRRRIVDRIGTSFAVLAVILALIPLGALIGFVVTKGAGALSVGFFTQGPPVIGQTGGGMYPMILGTVILILMTSAIGIPVGLLSGIYLARTGKGTFAQTARFLTDVIAGTPSILAGVIVEALVVFPTSTNSAAAGSIALALLMFPTVTRATEAAIRAVPRELREAALGLGSREWKLMARVVIPTAAPGIVTAIILGIARVAGETAPLVLTIVGNNFVNTNIFKGQMGALPLQIWSDAQSPSPVDHQAALAGAFVLFSLIVLLNLIARILTYRLSRRTRIA